MQSQLSGLRPGALRNTGKPQKAHVHALAPLLARN
jgi:hypothetical protein